MALTPKELHLRAKKELKVHHVKFEGCGQGRKKLEKCKSDAFCGMPGLDLYTNSFTYSLLFVNLSISLSKYLALTTRKPQHTSLHVSLAGRAPLVSSRHRGMKEFSTERLEISVWGCLGWGDT